MSLSQETVENLEETLSLDFRSLASVCCYPDYFFPFPFLRKSFSPYITVVPK